MRIEPHAYEPSWMHMGDCAVCGHLQNSAIHTIHAQKTARRNTVTVRRPATTVVELVVNETVLRLTLPQLKLLSVQIAQAIADWPDGR